MTEKTIIRKIKKGDQHALNNFIEELYPPIYRYLYCKVSKKEDAKDLTQEVFYRFSKQLQTYEWDGNVLAYLYTIASNCCASYYKQSSRYDYVELIEECAIDSSPMMTLLDKLQLEELLQLLHQLPYKDQDVMIFHYLKQLTFLEISQILQESEATIKTRHYRALAKIKKLWKEVNPDAFLR